MNPFALLDPDMKKTASFQHLLRGATQMVARNADDAGKALANRTLAATLMPKGQAFTDDVMRSLPGASNPAQLVRPGKQLMSAAELAMQRTPYMPPLVNPGPMVGAYAHLPSTRQLLESAMMQPRGSEYRKQLAQAIRNHRNSVPRDLAAQQRTLAHQNRHAPVIPLRVSPATPPPIPAASTPRPVTPPPLPAAQPQLAAARQGAGWGVPTAALLGGVGLGYGMGSYGEG